MRGIDVSSYQGRIDWNAVKKDNIDFVILRSILQSGKPDARFEEYYAGSVAAGYQPDVYVYMYDLSPESARVRARKVVDLIRGRKVKRVWLDMEFAAQRNLSKSRLTEIINTAAEVIQAAGYEVGIYCNQDWYNNVLDVANLPFMYWIARYGKNDGNAVPGLRPAAAVIWQHTSNGLVDGLAGRSKISRRGPGLSLMACVGRRRSRACCNVKFESIRRGALFVLQNKTIRRKILC